MNYIPPKLTLLISTLTLLGYVIFSYSFGEEKEAPSTAILEEKTAEQNEEITSEKSSTGKSQLPRPNEIVKNARDRLMEYKSIRADIKESVVFGDHQFHATGSYLQGDNLRLRLDFSVTVNRRLKGKLVQVCDGDVLWTHLKIGTRQEVKRRVVRDILEAAAADGKLSENILTVQLGLGGLPALLASLEENMVLNEVKEEKIDGVSFFVVQGRWSDKFLKMWKDPAPGRKNINKANGTSLPSRIPDRVRIYLEKKTLFPQRILYLKKHPTQQRYRQMVLLDFKNIKFNTSVNDKEFDFKLPEGVRQDDDTKRFLERLKPKKKEENKTK